MMRLQPFKVQLIHRKNWLFKFRFANAWFGRPELFLQATTVERIMKIKMPFPVCLCIWFWRNLFWIFCAADSCVVQMPHKVCAVTVRLPAYWDRSLEYRHARFTLDGRINEMAWSILILYQVFTITLLGVSQNYSAVFTIHLAMYIFF